MGGGQETLSFCGYRSWVVPSYVGVGESVRCHFGVADRSLDHGPRADVLSRAREGGEPDASENGYLEKQEGNSLGDLRLWEGQVATSVQMASITVTVVVVVAVV